MKKSLVAVASFFLVSCAPAFAQNAAPPDSATVAAVKELLVAMHARDTMVATLHQVEEQMPSQMRHIAAASINANPKLDDKQKAEALLKVDDSLRQARVQLHSTLDDPTLIDEMMAVMVPLYADTYTVAEIHELTAFYASPVGQKTVATMPELVGRSLQATTKIMMPRITKLMAQYVPPAAAAGK